MVQLFFIGSIILFSSCAGTFGKIKQYSFPDIRLNELKTKANNYLNLRPHLTDIDTSRYKVGKSTLIDGFYYLTIKSGETKYLLKYAYTIPVINNDTIPHIVLISGSIRGHGMPFAKDLKRSEKKLFSKLFEEYFIDNLNNYKH